MENAVAMRKPNLYSVIRTAVLSTGMAAIAATQAQPVITGITPDGSVLFQPSNTLAFVASAPAGVTNISVQLNGTKLSGATFLKIYTSASGLTIAAATNGGQSVSAPLIGNTVYSAIITATDANGVSTTSTVAFDTITPAYTFEAEDFDFEGGQFIDNPQTNAYRGKIAVPDVDSIVSGGNNNYRPLGLATETCRDTKRVQYTSADATLIDYDVGWNDNGKWANYTRTFPTGKFNVYYRASNDGSAQNKMQMTWPDDGALYNFFVPVTGNNQVYTYGPLNDSAGVLAALDFNGVKTLRMQTVNGSYNGNFYMLVAASTPEVSDAAIVEPYPDGAAQFQMTNQFGFKVTSTLGVKAGDIVVQLTDTSLLTSQANTTILTAGDGLTVSGASNNLVVNFPLRTNVIYSAAIFISDALGVPVGATVKFDTIAPNYYTWEAEDWDYEGGRFIDNPTPNAYSGLNGLVNVDYVRLNPTQGSSAYGREGLAQEGCDDIPRLSREGAADYDIGNNGGGNWVNYTRTWPAGTYNIFIRIAKGGSGTTANAGTLSLVTSGVGSPTQTTSLLGNYSSPATGGWQVYNWQPLRNTAGDLVRFESDGTTVKTLRHTVAGGNANQGFYMLVPADLTAQTAPFISDFQPDGTSMFNNTNKFSFTVNSAAGVTQDKVVVMMDGIKMANLDFKGNANEWKVTGPLSINGFHTVVASVIDNYGGSTNTVQFTTFDQATAFFFEAEDYDHDGGLFIDPAADFSHINAYAGLEALVDIDTHTAPGNFDGTHVSYRPSGLNQEGANDILTIPGRADLGFPNYDLGFTAGGNWGNYTRTYPAGTFNIYMRVASDGGASGGSMVQVTAGLGTVNQTTVPVGVFGQVPRTGPNGWQVYTWVPLNDQSGNLAQFTGGGVKTLRAICGGGQNNDYYVLVPVDNTKPVVSGLYPDGATAFQATNTLRFVATSSAGIDTSAVSVTLNGVVLTDLVFSGTSSNLTVSYPKLVLNTNYSASIAIMNKNGGVYSMSFSFDTYSASYYTWEAEDFDYTENGVSGKYFDGQVGAYYGKEILAGVDGFQEIPVNGEFNYRLYDIANPSGNLVPGTPTADDAARPQFVGKTDYRINWYGPGSWLNYTHKYPAGKYYVQGRFTEGDREALIGLSKVTAGYGTPNQTVSQLGTFFVNVGSWTTWQNNMLMDDNRNLVTITLDGTQTTLRLSDMDVSGGPTINANYFMLIPVASATAPTLTASLSGGKIDISFGTQAGFSYQVQYKNSLRDASWTPLGSPVLGNGAVQSVNDSSAGSSRFYRVEILLHP
jgi:hypothetical protein